MKVLPIFKKYMVPFLTDNGFITDKVEPTINIFVHKDNYEIKIFFEFYPGEIATSVRRNDKGLLPYYPLNIFFDEPSEMHTKCKDDWWRYDNEEELIGLFEQQAILLKDKAFKWMFGSWDLDLDTIINSRTKEFNDIYNSANDNEKKLILNQRGKELEEWKATRFKPTNWK